MQKIISLLCKDLPVLLVISVQLYYWCQCLVILAVYCLLFHVILFKKRYKQFIAVYYVHQSISFCFCTDMSFNEVIRKIYID